MKKQIEQVKKFMTAMGQDVPTVPTMPSEDVRKLRFRLAIEELEETFDAVDPKEILDGLVDQMYVLFGTAAAFGLADKMVAGFEIVHDSNMSKLMPDGSVLRREDGKVMKPDTYVAPDLSVLFE